MKKLTFIPIMLLTMIIISCKKDKDIPIGTFSANINGTKTTFLVMAKASVVPVQNGFGIQIFGYKKDPATSATSMSLLIARPTPITQSTYTENNADNPLVEMDYSFDFLFGATNSYSSYHSTTNPLTVNITDISTSSVKGRFQGELQGADFNGGVITTQISNGVFHVSF